MSLVIAHMQKNRKYSSITCHKFNSLYTHGINWEWLWVRNYEHTHRPTHRVASGINSVMGLKNKTKKTGRRNTENTNTIFCPFKSSSSHRNATLRSSSNVFLCFAKPAESRNNGEAFSSYKNKTEKSYLGHMVAGGHQSTVVAAGHCWWNWAASAAVQLSPRSSVLPKNISKISTGQTGQAAGEFLI